MRSTLIAAILLTFGAAPAQSTPKLDYGAPGTLVDVDGGRRVNMICAGTGGPTVLLIAGLGNSAVVWDQVQPRIAETTRVCALDRPGFGFSDGSSRPQTTAERTRDIEHALRAAHISGPYVIVGHSLGSYESLVFADRNRTRTVGMVLVDPSIPDQVRLLFMNRPAAGAYTLKGRTAAMQFAARCTDQARAGTLKPGAGDPDGCLQYLAYYPQRLVKRLQVLDQDPLRAEARLSLYRNSIDSADSRTAPVVNPKRNYGDMPLIVLSSDPPSNPPDAPADAVAEQPAVQAEWRAGHIALAKLSTRGQHRIIPGSQHAIQRTNPDAVIDAVVQVVTAARSTH